MVWSIRKFCAALGVAASLALAAAPARADVFADVISRGTIKIGIPVDLIPFGYMNANREPEGFDIDLANRLATALGVKAELIPITGANRIPYLLTGRVDITVFAMGLTAERAKQVMFSSPYVYSVLGVFGPKSIAISSIADLKNHKIAATKGNTEEIALSDAGPDLDIMRTENDATTIATYLSGQADLFAASSFVPIELRRRYPGKEFELKLALRPSSSHMAVRIGEHNMLQWVNSFIFALKEDGTLDKLNHKWLGTPMGTVKPL